MKVLAIGNSFSTDATYFLHQIGEAAGIENLVVNLYIGGCPLERHWKNIEEGLREYQYQVNGVKTDRYVSIQDILNETDWDVIVTHQASHDSGWLDTYEPFLGNIIAYLHENAPKARIFFNETWAYEKNSTHGNFARYGRNQQEMYERLYNAYHTMAEKYKLPLIPSGELIQKLRETEYFCEETAKRSICRDGFHMNYLYGRYAVACMWAKKIFGITVSENTFIPQIQYMPFEKTDMEIITTIRRLADEM